MHRHWLLESYIDMADEFNLVQPEIRSAIHRNVSKTEQQQYTLSLTTRLTESNRGGDTITKELRYIPLRSASFRCVPLASAAPQQLSADLSSS